MIEKFKKEYKRFIKKQYNRLFGNYDTFPLPCYWNDEWKKYYIKNFESIEQKLNSLKSNMDEKSKEIAELVYKRYVFINPWLEHNNNLLVDNNKLFTEEELRDQSEDFYVDKKKFILPVDYEYALSVYKYDSGLCFLEPHTLKQIENKDIIDGGAFIGDSAIVFNKYNPAKIFSFEPDKDNFRILQETVKLNNLEHIIIPVNKGLGDKEEEIILYGQGPGASTMNKSCSEFSTIKVTTIDSFVKENNLSVGLIKLDIEGFELETIQSSIQTIKEHKPLLLISLYHQPKDFFEIKPLIESLNLNYNFMIRKIDPRHHTVETILIGYAKNE